MRIPHEKICGSLERLETPSTSGRARIQDTGYSKGFAFERGAKVGATGAPDLSKDVIEFAFARVFKRYRLKQCTCAQKMSTLKLVSSLTEKVRT